MLRQNFTTWVTSIAAVMALTAAEAGAQARKNLSPRLRATANRRPKTESLIRKRVETEAARYRIDPNLISAMINQESGGQTNVVSPKGAVGLMQLMPETARHFRVSNRNDPNESIRAGTQYLVELLDHFGGNVRLALAAYNSGPARVVRYHGIPPIPETRSYVQAIEARYLKTRRREAPETKTVPGPRAAAPVGTETEYSYHFRVGKEKQQ